MGSEEYFASSQLFHPDTMVSTRGKGAEVPTRRTTLEMGDAGPSSNISCILKAQARMQLEFAEYKKRNADVLEAPREENSQLRRRIETDKAMGGPRPVPSRADPSSTKEESEYRPTGHTTGGNYNSFTSRRNRKHPFVDRIIETPLPHKRKALTVTYDDTTDSNEFIFVYTNQVTLSCVVQIFFSRLEDQHWSGS